MRGKVVVLAPAALAFALVVSACGGTGNAASGSGSAAASDASRNDAQLKFARCMRDHGVEIEDPKPGSGGGFRLAIRGNRGDEKKLEKAQKECQKLAPGGFREPTPEEQEKFRDAALAFARCMRAHGVDMPDPEFEGGRTKVTMRGERGDEKKIQAAEKTCQKLMPKPPTQEEGS
jgi:hypothetical protein